MLYLKSRLEKSLPGMDDDGDHHARVHNSVLVLARKGPATVQQIVQHSGLSPAHAVLALDHLVKQGKVVGDGKGFRLGGLPKSKRRGDLQLQGAQGQLSFEKAARKGGAVRPLFDAEKHPREPKGETDGKHKGGQFVPAFGGLKPGQKHPDHPDWKPVTDAQRAEVHAIGTDKPVPPVAWELELAPDRGENERGWVASWRDWKGRKQMAYTLDARAERQTQKFNRLARITVERERILKQLQRDLGRKKLSVPRVAAGIVALIDATTMRVGNEQYAGENGTYGASSLRKEHVTVKGQRVTIRFRGKMGREWQKELVSRELALLIKTCLMTEGDRLFMAQEMDGSWVPVDARRVNDYLRPYGVTAKDFRTYHASRLMAEELAKAPPVHDESAVDRTVKEVLKRVAEHLGHTPAICRKNYVDPTVVEAYRKGIKARRAQRDLAL